MRTKWLKVISYGLILFGIAIILFSLFRIFEQKNSVQESLKVAKAAIVNDSSIQREEGETLNSPAQYNFKQGDIIGLLQIPKLERELPIIEGVDGEELKRGVGHYAGTMLPNQSNQIFLAGHRDTAFRDMGDLERGDLLTIVLSTEAFTYKIFDMYIVNKYDVSVIRSTSPREILTLSTCYPFTAIGSSEERYIIEAERVLE
ncbi:class D sortase [Bacillus spongiae]|uniref:Class D sortase n=1 Tax=Bacillus spongiae TaxID=2683610 RepID=A0ABU8HEC8_9BACI